MDDERDHDALIGPGPVAIKLARRRSARISAALCATALALGGAGWLAFCLTAKPGPDAAPSATTVLRAMALVSLPMFLFAARLARDAVSNGRVVLTGDMLSIVLPRTLREPLTLSRARVARAIVDPEGQRNDDERLRFQVAPGRFLYSSVTGSEAPFLGAEPAIPNLALVFDAPVAFEEPRRRSNYGGEFAPLLPLEPGVAVPGLLLWVGDPGSARLALGRWLGRSDDTPARIEPDGTRVPLSSEGLSRTRILTWRSALLLAACVVFGGAGGRAAHIGNPLVVAVGVFCLCGGYVLDAHLRREERHGLARLPSFGLLGVGLMLIMVASVASSPYS